MHFPAASEGVFQRSLLYRKNLRTLAGMRFYFLLAARGNTKKPELQSPMNQIHPPIETPEAIRSSLSEPEFYGYVLQHTIPDPDPDYVQLHKKLKKSRLEMTRDHGIRGRQHFILLKDPDVVIYPVIRKTRFMMKDGKKFLELHSAISDFFGENGAYMPRAWIVMTSTLCSKTGRFLLENDFMISSLIQDGQMYED